ncbi:immunoglobulin lambda-1 light chain-like [Tachyglossus aculeatus]|uniref:immunoglobulin lambda-1 light chain-like n=1 Tax=Tachyglossus aculeatus TaxID=9261 RepID=UPI0018F28E5C|nr:immunoglobulin lambda-1 light chain-like [Tachyglossus aculeatus]
MAQNPLLFVLLLFTVFPGLGCQPMLIQVPSVAAARGATVQLVCTLSGVSGDHPVQWFQQREGKAPRFVLHIPGHGGRGSRGDGIPDRFGGSASGHHRYLTIRDVQPEDEADYYCGMAHDGAASFGGGTQLTVLRQPKTSPTVTVFAPSAAELYTDRATLVCLMGGFYPGFLSVAWKADGVAVSEGVETSAPARRRDGSYVASSFLALSPAQWRERGSYTCQVTHDGKVFEKSVSPTECA